jgi:hypothetical protein
MNVSRGKVSLPAQVIHAADGAGTYVGRRPSPESLALTCVAEQPWGNVAGNTPARKMQAISGRKRNTTMLCEVCKGPAVDRTPPGYNGVKIKASNLV